MSVASRSCRATASTELRIASLVSTTSGLARRHSDFASNHLAIVHPSLKFRYQAISVKILLAIAMDFCFDFEITFYTMVVFYTIR